MRNCWVKVVSVLVFTNWYCQAIAIGSFGQDELQGLVERNTKRTPGGVHLPIVRQKSNVSSVVRRATGDIGLGDYTDVTYNVMLSIGSVVTPLVLDTGSSDLWVASSACTNCRTTEPLYPVSTFQPTGLDAHLLYGDSMTGTHAFGPIGIDTVTVANSGLKAEKQCFAAIDDTNTTVLATGSTGIFGLGFPINSFIWSQMFRSQNIPGSTSRRSDVELSGRHSPRRLSGSNYKRLGFPSIADLYPPASPKRQQGVDPAVWTENILSSFGSLGPFLSRLMMASSAGSELSLPLIAITLQRDSIAPGSGNLGTLSIGELPEGVDANAMTWVPIRGYSPEQGGLYSPANSPNKDNGGEKYPIAWELFVDDVYLDGVKLPHSNLTPPTLQTSALIDTGNSLIRGPPDVVQYILSTISPPSSGPTALPQSAGTFPCSQAHVLSFKIGGKMFNVDPRDFIGQVFEGDTKDCRALIASTDVPSLNGGGYLYSWSLGDPFLKGVLAAFHYGNITYPSQNPPTIGLLSTVSSDPSTLDSQLTQALGDIQGDNFPVSTEPAPTTFPSGSVIGGGDGNESPAAQGTGTVPAPSASTAAKLGSEPSAAVRVNVGWLVGIMGLMIAVGGRVL